MLTTVKLSALDIITAWPGDPTELVKRKLMQAGMTEEQVKASTIHQVPSMLLDGIIITAEYPDAATK